MFIASIILTVVFMVWVFSLSGWNPVYILDIPSAIVVFGIVIIVLLGTGLIKDFGRAFRIAFYDKKDYKLTDIKKSTFAVKLAMISVMVNGFMATVFNLFMFGAVSDSFQYTTEIDMAMALFSMNISVSILPMFYSVFFALLMLPVYGVLKRRSIEYMGE